MRTLITFIGRPPRRDGGSYRETQYDFGPDFSELSSQPVAFFGWVLKQYLEQKTPLDRMVILGTSGSMWDHLFEHDLNLGDTEEDRRLTLFEDVARKAVDQSQLDLLAPLLEQHYGIPILLRIIPYCNDESEQVELLRIIDSVVSSGEQIELDVTHGFRHLPMLALLAALFLRSIRGVEVGSIWYGAYDPDTGKSPVHNLIGLLQIADWLRALATFDKDGDYAGFAELLGGEQDNLLAEASFYERINNTSNARQKLTSWFEQEHKTHLLDSVSSLFFPILEERLEWRRKPTRSQHELSLAGTYLEKRDYLRAVIYAMEGLVTADCEQGGDPNNFDSRKEARKYLNDNQGGFETLGDIRNALAHGVRTRKKQLNRILIDERSLLKELHILFNQLKVGDG